MATVSDGPCRIGLATRSILSSMGLQYDDISEEILGAKVKKGTGSKRCEKAKRAWKACKKEDGDPFECFYKEYKDDKVYGKMSDLCLGSFPSANKKDRKFICFLLAIAKGACHADAGFLDSENLG